MKIEGQVFQVCVHIYTDLYMYIYKWRYGFFCS